MRPVELLFVLAASAYSAGRILQERRRLHVLTALSGAEARALHERHRRVHDRTLLVIALACALAALGLLGYAAYLEGGARAPG